MKTQGAIHAAARLLAACAALTLAGCSIAAAQPELGGTYFGSTQNLGNGTVRTYVAVGADGHPSAVGIRMSETALEGLSDTELMVMLDLPDHATTVFDHVMLNWNPHGHEPGILFGKPHFDMHFYMTDMASIHAIDPRLPDYAVKAAHLPEARYMPRDYITPPEPLGSQLTAPFMGVHWIDATAGMIPGIYDFTQTFINGSWDGQYTFMEPMITREWLLTKPTIHEYIKQPHAYQHTAHYPTTYSVQFSSKTDEYDIVLAGMTMRQSS